MTGKDVLTEKGLLEKVATIKSFECSLLGIELKKQTYIEKKKQGLDKVYQFDKKEDFNPTWAELFWKSQDWGEGASRSALKKHAVSQKRFVHFT